MRTAIGKPAAHYESGEVAIMRSDWDSSALRLAVNYSDGGVKLELGAGRRTLLSGPWTLGLEVDGDALPIESPWSETCWVSDAGGDYLEIECKLSAGVRVQRQIFLARRQRFLVLADAVLDAPGPFEYAATLPLTAGLTFEPAVETSEGYLGDGKHRALVLPLSLPEWRTGARHGQFRQTVDGLELRQRTEGRAIFAPLFIDLDRRRFRKPFTWRHLTVVDSRRIVTKDVAVGYRIQVDAMQWLIYRSLAETRAPVGLGTASGQ